MRHTASISLVLLTLTASAKNYDTCRVYQYFGNESDKKELVLKQVYNETGKLIYEAASHYLNYENVARTSTVSEKPDGEYYYVYDNDNLIATTSAFAGSGFSELTDSCLNNYFYNDRGKRQMSVLRSHVSAMEFRTSPKGRSHQEMTPKRWRAADTTIYFYDANNDNLIAEQRRCDGRVSTSRHYYNFDNSGRSLLDSVVEEGGSLVTKYTYSADGFSKEVRNYRGDVVRYQYKLGKSGEILSERKSENNSHGQYSTTETLYNEAHRVVTEKYFAGDALMTTREYVYK